MLTGEMLGGAMDEADGIDDKAGFSCQETLISYTPSVAHETERDLQGSFEKGAGPADRRAREA